MTDEQELFSEIGLSIKNAEQSQMFGKPSFKVNGKAFTCFFQDEMVFKLTDDAHAEALALDGSQLFDPSGKKRVMKEWVQVPCKHKGTWKIYAAEAMKYVSEK